MNRALVPTTSKVAKVQEPATLRIGYFRVIIVIPAGAAVIPTGATVIPTGAGRSEGSGMRSGGTLCFQPAANAFCHNRRLTKSPPEEP